MQVRVEEGESARVDDQGGVREAALGALPLPRGPRRQLEEQQRDHQLYKGLEWLPAAPPSLHSAELYAVSSRPHKNINPLAPRRLNRANVLSLPPPPESIFLPQFSEADLKGKKVAPLRIVTTFLQALTSQLPGVALRAISHAQQSD